MEVPSIKKEAFEVCRQISCHPLREQLKTVLTKYTRNSRVPDSKADMQEPEAPEITFLDSDECHQPTKDPAILGDQAQLLGHQFAGYLACHERYQEYRNKVDWFPKMEPDEVLLLEWGHRLFRGMAAEILGHFPSEVTSFLSPYARLNPSALSHEPVGGDVKLSTDALAAAFIGHPSLEFLKRRDPQLALARLTPFVDSLKVAAGGKQHGKLQIDPKKASEVAYMAKRDRCSFEHLGVSIFCLADSIKNLFQLLFSSFRLDKLPYFDEERVFGVTPQSYGTFDLSEIRLAELGLGIIPRDPILVSLPTIGWEAKKLGFLHKLSVHFSQENGIETGLFFRTVDDNLSGFSNLI